MTAILLSSLLAAAPVPEDVKKQEAKFYADVAKAREKAIGYLKQQQKPDGSWDEGTTGVVFDMRGGVTALATLALLEAGVPADAYVNIFASSGPGASPAAFSSRHIPAQQKGEF